MSRPLPAGWDKTTDRGPKPPPNVAIRDVAYVPPVTPSEQRAAAEQRSAARRTLQRHAAADLAEMLGVA